MKLYQRATFSPGGSENVDDDTDSVFTSDTGRDSLSTLSCSLSKTSEHPLACPNPKLGDDREKKRSDRLKLSQQAFKAKNKRIELPESPGGASDGDSELARLRAELLKAKSKAVTYKARWQKLQEENRRVETELEEVRSELSDQKLELGKLSKENGQLRKEILEKEEKTSHVSRLMEKVKRVSLVNPPSSGGTSSMISNLSEDVNLAIENQLLRSENTKLSLAIKKAFSASPPQSRERTSGSPRGNMDSEKFRVSAEDYLWDEP
eukprot:CAMPEP_0183294734 /NCGR_PEP_ID=MMETSP0160_2-20130417/2950_1 /TAXON_ID=2839 ORGANISM="Odontella Sinensis, Strain Grunow 1884" /NCGR_SAMPLE_ID=MMETSP0160_2 /ASSEMBLY_ACC=CAM_ASM_000250 /LENGTH=263 /DNA_ID=CAMNT_0025456095 /DNA_START=14 /DNA_END=805 /DNA_ORIENTATION=+